MDHWTAGAETRLDTIIKAAGAAADEGFASHLKILNGGAACRGRAGVPASAINTLPNAREASHDHGEL
jgi:hypothetical protein